MYEGFQARAALCHFFRISASQDFRPSRRSQRVRDIGVLFASPLIDSEDSVPESDLSGWYGLQIQPNPPR